MSFTFTTSTTPVTINIQSFEDYRNHTAYGEPKYSITLDEERLIFHGNYTDSEAQVIINKLKNCKCCNVHSIGKPDIYGFRYTFVSRKDAPERTSNAILDENNEKISFICKCPCRHHARAICDNYFFVSH